MANQTVEKLKGLLSNENFRKNLVSNPNSALTNEGIDPTQLPNGYLEALSSLSEEELDSISKISAKTNQIDAAYGDGGLMF